MIKRGTVIELNEKVAIIISENSNFNKIKRKNNMYVGQQIYFDKSDIIVSDSKKIKYISYAVACFFIFFATYFMIFLNGKDKISSQVNSVYSIVEFESNIQNDKLNFEIDESGKIIGQYNSKENKYNSSLKSVDIIKSYLEDLIDEYPKEERILIISSSLYNSDNKFSKEGLELSIENIKIIVNEYLKDLNYVRYVELSEKERLKAEEHNLSMAKYYGYMLENGSKKTVDIEDANDITLKDYYTDNSNDVNEWETGFYYKVDDMVIYEDNIYVCLNNHVSQYDYVPDKSEYLWKIELGDVIVTSDSDSNTTETKNPNELWKAGISYKAEDTVIYDNIEYICIQSHKSQADWPPNLTSALWIKN